VSLTFRIIPRGPISHQALLSDLFIVVPIWPSCSCSKAWGRSLAWCVRSPSAAGLDTWRDGVVPAAGASDLLSDRPRRPHSRRAGCAIVLRELLRENPRLCASEPHAAGGGASENV
jgi:hypothetical protein